MARRQFSATPVKRYFVLLRRSSRRRIRENKRATVRRGFMTGSILEIDTIADSLVGPFLSPSLFLSLFLAVTRVGAITRIRHPNSMKRRRMHSNVSVDGRTGEQRNGWVGVFIHRTHALWRDVIRGITTGWRDRESWGGRIQGNTFRPFIFYSFVVIVWLKILSYFAKIVNNSYSLDFLDLPLFLSFLFSYPLSLLLSPGMVNGRSESQRFNQPFFRLISSKLLLFSMNNGAIDEGCFVVMAQGEIASNGNVTITKMNDPSRSCFMETFIIKQIYNIRERYFSRILI